MLRPLCEALPRLSSKTHGIYLFAALMVATGLFAFRSIDDLDYGIHVATGRWIIQNGKVPITDPFTWSIPEHSYVAYHWGFQVILAFLYESLGHLGPVLLRFVLVCTTAGVIAWALSVRGVFPVVGGACGLLALIAAEPRFAVRPELCTGLFVACTILSLDLWRRGNSRALLTLPLIFVGWINTHVYILGFVLVGAELLDQVVNRRISRGFIFMVVLSGLAVFLNPYGLEAVTEPIRLFTRMDGGNIFKRTILELASPMDLPDDPRTPFGPVVQLWSWSILCILTAPACVFLLRARRVGDALVACAFCALSLVAIRNISLFAIASLPAIASGLSLWASQKMRYDQWYVRGLFTALMIAITVIWIRVPTGAWYATQRRIQHFSSGVERATLAIEAADFVEVKALQGRGFNSFNVGGALLLRAPNHKIFIDGRNEVTGEAFLARYHEILNPTRFDEFTAAFNIEYLVLGHPAMLPLIRHVIASNLWVPVHYDSVAMVFVRKAGPNGHLPPKPLPPPIEDLQERWRHIQRIKVRPSLIDSFSRWLLGGEEVPYEMFKLGTFLLSLGQWAEAERPMLYSAIRAPNFWETHNNLGALYFRMQDWEAATLMYRGVLMLNSSYAFARERERISWARFQKSFSEKAS